MSRDEFQEVNDCLKITPLLSFSITYTSVNSPNKRIYSLKLLCLDPLLILLEYLPYGDLLGYLRKSRGHSDSYNTGEKKPASKLTAKDLLSFAWMIADGMYYLAKMKVS